MEFTVNTNTVRLVEAFQARHLDTRYDSGKSKSAALNGALMMVNAYLGDEKTGATLLQVGKTGDKWPEFTMKDLFAAAAARKPATGSSINLKTNAIEISPIHAFLKEQKILGDQSTAGEALDLAIMVAHDLVDKGPLAIRTKQKDVVGRLVFI